MNIQEVRKIVEGIQTHLFKSSNSFSLGILKSHFRGAGIQFKEHQVYNVGDDVRFIDWKLSAKTNSTYVKTFEEERNIEIVVFIDFSESMLIGAAQKTKLQASIELTCLLFLLAEKSKDKVRVVILAEEILTMKPLSGNEGIIVLISLLEKNNFIDKSGRVNILKRQDKKLDDTKKLSLIKSYLARRKEIVYLGDTSSFDNIESFMELTYRPNMHTFQILSPLDLSHNLEYRVLLRQDDSNSFSNQGTKQEEGSGRLKRINVRDRYLEDFVREML